MLACKPLPYGQLTTSLVLLFHLPASFDSPLQSPKLEKHFCVSVSFVLIHFVMGELLSEVSGRVSHGLVLVWFESYVLRLVL